MRHRKVKKIETEKAINIAISCVMISHLEMIEKREVIDSLRQLKEKTRKYESYFEENSIESIEKKLEPYGEKLEKLMKGE